MGIGDRLNRPSAGSVARAGGERTRTSRAGPGAAESSGSARTTAGQFAAHESEPTRAGAIPPHAGRRAVFLDRDGVLNAAPVDAGGTPHPPASVDELTLLPGVAEACASLRDAGFLLIVVTNQPDVARGTQERAQVEAINAALRARLPVDEVRVCYHDDTDGCACRKPKPGLLLDAARQLGIDLGASFLVGDRWRDIGAGRAAGCRTLLVDYGYAEGQKHAPDACVTSLSEAVTWILQLDRERKSSRER